jgi:hypothetical protein
MDPTETGAMSGGETPGENAPGETNAGGETPVDAAPQPQQTAEVPPAPAAKAPKKDRNWTLIALVAVSVIAVLLLVATVCLAVTGDFGHHGRFDRFDGRPGPMMRQWDGGGQLRDGMPRWRQQDQDGSGDQNQPQQSAPVAPQGGGQVQ